MPRDVVGGKGLRERIQAHSKWLTVLGAAIVFAMFVVKDAYRESLKEIVYSIQAAETSFQIISGFTRVDVHLRIIEQQTFVDQTPKELLRLGQMVRKRMNAGDEGAASISNEGVNFQKTLGEYETDVKNLEHLLSEVPGHQEDRHFLEETEAAIQDAYKSEAEDHSKDGQKSGEKGSPRIESAMADESREATSAEILASLTDAEEHIVQDAEKERDLREERLRTYTITSYVLYPIGWLIGLVGKLTGTPAMGGE